MSSATEVPPDRFAVKKLLAGSIVADIHVTAGFSGAGPTAKAIVADLQLQAADPASTLMHGLVTKFTQNIVILPAAVRIPARHIHLPVHNHLQFCVRNMFGGRSDLCNVFPILRWPT